MHTLDTVSKVNLKVITTARPLKTKEFLNTVHHINEALIFKINHFRMLEKQKSRNFNDKKNLTTQS